jgi:hypothetical protein
VSQDTGSGPVAAAILCRVNTTKKGFSGLNTSSPENPFCYFGTEAGLEPAMQQLDIVALIARQN